MGQRIEAPFRFLTTQLESLHATTCNQGSIKDLKFSLLSGQVALTFCLPWVVLVFLFNDLIGRWLAWRASENEKLLPKKENLLVPDDRTALFSNLHVEALERFISIYTKHYYLPLWLA